MNNDESKDTTWERSVINELATEALKEKRRTRRWGIFFKILTFLYVGVLLFLLLPDQDWDPAKIGEKKEHTALVELEGVIADGEKAEADTIVEGLRDAFEHKHTKAVILRINSPGGSPVQSSYIHKEMLRLKEEYPDIPLYAVVSDLCASGGYYVASAADKIYVDESSILGSIGVLMNGFGFTELIDELGVERRLLTAGEHKGILDPFSPVSEFDVKHVYGMLQQLHENFITAVKTGRGDRLSDTPELFSGLFWDGQKSIELGLADEIGSAGYVAREVVEAEDIVDFTPKEDPIERLANRLGASAAAAFVRMTGMGGTPQM